jgi:hypothetical protein
MMTRSHKSSVPHRIRSPLAPVETSLKRLQSTIRMDNASDVSDLQQVSLFDFGESEFELMHVTVTVHALTGLLSDRPSMKKRAMDVLTPKSKKTLDPFPEGTASSSSMSSSNGVGSYVDKAKIPTFAIATFGRNVTSSETSIKTHLPSKPIGIPTSSFGYVNRYMAQWQEPKPQFLREQGKVDQVSSFTFLRVMMREGMNLGEEMQESTTMSKYVHETIDIEINLSRGKEIIPLGVATLAITGDETGPTQMSLPARPIVYKGKKAVLGNSADLQKRKNKLFKKKLKRSSFPSDPKRTYFLDENSTLIVTVVLTPQESIDDAHAREQAREIRKQMKLEDYQDQNSIVLTEQGPPSRTRGPPSRTSLTTASIGKNQNPPVQKSSSSFLKRSLLCGSCTALERNEVEVKDHSSHENETNEDYTVDSSTFEQEVQEKYGYSLASSVLSSVSESESSYSDESEDPRIHLNRKIVIRKRSGEHPKKSRGAVRNH